MTSSPPAPLTIGVFDSGFGGLTVLRALLPLFPGARFHYLGDSARLPYGAKSRQTVTRYTLSSARFLIDKGADLLVIACNTASALSLADIKADIRSDISADLRATLPIPIIGVIEPGAQAAAAPHHHLGKLSPVPPPHVLVLATPATVESHAYSHALAALGLPSTEKACPLLVPLIEEGWTNHPVTADVLRIYLSEALAEAPNATTLVLGCTHYPLIKPLIETTLQTLKHSLQIVDSAEATALSVARHLAGATVHPSSGHPTTTFYATDSIEKFRRLGTHFLGQPIPEVHLIDLGG